MTRDLALNEIGILKRREIEVRILAPILDALGKVFGESQVLEITRQTIVTIARQQGRELSEELNRNDLSAYRKSIESWSRHGALEFEILNQTETNLEFDVTRCRYAELYRDLGLVELGAILSCSRDVAFIEGFNPEIKLERTCTVMQGSRVCDFRYSIRTT